MTTLLYILRIALRLLIAAAFLGYWSLAPAVDQALEAYSWWSAFRTHNADFLWCLGWLLWAACIIAVVWDFCVAWQADLGTATPMDRFRP